MNILSERYEQQVEHRKLAGSAWEAWHTEAEHNKALVFTNEIGHHLQPKRVYLHFKKIAEEIGATDARVHDLRHTFAVLSLQNRDDVKTVQINLGHASAAFTLDVYGHVSDRMQCESAARMEQYIASVPEWNQTNKMNNPLPGTAKFSTQMCQRKQTDGVTVVVKNTAEDFEAEKASHKCKNRLETKHFKTILAGEEGFEPSAYGFGDRRSTS